jgi:3-deoxy-7-phosphoheptulonate synthase
MEQLEKAKLPTSIMIDCSHDNSRKNHLNQPTVAQSIVRLTSVKTTHATHE